jgi:hypothetical protein
LQTLQRNASCDWIKAKRKNRVGVLGLPSIDQIVLVVVLGTEMASIGGIAAVVTPQRSRIGLSSNMPRTPKPDTIQPGSERHRER